MRARDNPFSTDRLLRVRYRLGGGSWEPLLERLEMLGRRAAIVGPHGSGKTTLWEDLAARLNSAGFRVRMIRLNETRRNLPRRDPVLARAGRTDLLMVDGAELLGRLSWLRLKKRSRHAAGLIITTIRPGRLPTLIECRTSPELARQIVEELVGEIPPQLAARLPSSFARHGGNIRDLLRECYDLHAARPDDFQTVVASAADGLGELRVES